MHYLRSACEEILEGDSKALFADGFEDAIIGIAHRFGKEPVVCYDIDMCIEILMQRDGMTEEEANEFFDFNTLGAYMGEGTPIYVQSVAAEGYS